MLPALRGEMTMESIDYSYISKRFEVICAKCDFRSAEYRTEQFANQAAHDHRIYMADYARQSGHDCAVNRIA
jgi:hypothetical protein